jgi:hypothetical protein
MKHPVRNTVLFLVSAGITMMVATTINDVFAAAPEKSVRLTAYEEGQVVAGAHVAYSLGLLTLDTTTLNTGTAPYICWPFPVEWDQFYLMIEDNVKAQIADLTNKERRDLGENFKYRVSQAVFEEFGCY